MKSTKCPECGQQTTEKYCPRCGVSIPQTPIYKKIHKPTYIVSAIWILGSISIAPEQLKEMGFIGFLSTFFVGLIIFSVITQIICESKKRKKITQKHSDCNIKRNSINPNQNVVQTVESHDFNQSFDNMDGHTFEHYCADILSKNGFYNVEVTKGSGDQGIDIIAHKDGVKYGIQCKCYSSDIGNKAVQEAFSGKTFYGCHVAAVLTNRYFTKSAKELSENNKVLLWDRDKLEEYIRNADNNQKQY